MIGGAAALLAISGAAVVLSQSNDSKNTKIDEAIGILEEAKAIPADTVTVTETIMATLTSSSAPPTTKPTTPPPSSCQGVDVSPGGGLKAAMDSNPGGTFCLAAGTYNVNSTISTQAGDRVIGSGRNATHIDGSGLSSTAVGIFNIAGNSYFTRFDIFGAPTPSVGSGTFCAPDKSRCGRAFHTGSQTLTIESIDCHDNGSNCVGGGGNATVVADDIDCYANGNAYSMTSSFRSAACIKRAAIYGSGGNTTVTNSYIHDNPWVGLWCDFCKYGVYTVKNNVIEHNGIRGFQWEMSGGWTSEDRAVVTGNTFTDNGYRTNDPAGAAVGQRGGVNVGTANDILIEGNTFGGNETASIYILFTVSRGPPQPNANGVVVRDNTLNGDPIVGCNLSGVTCG